MLDYRSDLIIQQPASLIQQTLWLLLSIQLERCDCSSSFNIGMAVAESSMSLFMTIELIEKLLQL